MNSPDAHLAGPIPVGPILVGVGSNLPGERFATPRAACEAAARALEEEGLRVTARSRWFESAPVPVSDQPWYVNGVLSVATALPPDDVLALLHRVEARFGRIRRERNEARVIDLDLLAYGSLLRDDPPPVLPHPRLHQRAFVLLPLQDVAPDWTHPRLGTGIAELVAALPPGQAIRPVA
ncbi:MAG TPA: 2-amino-4-hydroxy-6-hydroxymethyldihydropteridine diphosphokinase [Azospirillaceae bacterium]|nr:2-amino-4-hydroxy-6-hydroxymethyldihydropteridine diphosphokinase [Azospirillaceae bacterium]